MPGLFTSEDIENVVQDMEVLRNSYPGQTLFEAFSSRIRENMMIVLSLDHRNPEFNKACSSNPAFLSNCRIIWLSKYTEESLKIYGLKSLGKIPEIESLVEAALKIHSGSMRTFCDYIATFKQVYNSSIGSKGDKTNRLNKGLSKLREAEETVDKLNGEAAAKKKLLAVKQKEADNSLTQITEAMAEASVNKAEA